MAATNPGDGSRAHRPYLESRRTTFVSRPSSQGLKPVSRLRGTAPHFEALANHHFVSLGMASDRGLGLVAGYQAACDMALWVADYFHEFQDLFELLYQLERKAYAAMNKEYDAARTFAHAKSEANL